MLYDISPPISEELAVWPGDTPFCRQERSDYVDDGIALSSVHTTVHIGSHVDAFGHTVAGEATVDRMGLDTFIGPAQVIRVEVRRGEVITPKDLAEDIVAPRVLLSTGTYPDYRRFNEDYAALSLELVDLLKSKQVCLVGIDTPSVDLFAVEDLPVHRRLVEARIASLEGIRLVDVPAGCYELIALPLRLVGCDASPVRAILRSG